MSSDSSPELRESPKERDEDERSPFSTKLATLGKKMRVYGNSMLVLMILMFLVSIFLFTIIFNPVISSLIVIYFLKIFEFSFYIDYLNSLKNSEENYGGHYLRKAFITFTCMITLSFVILVIGTIFVALNLENLNLIYTTEGVRVEKVFFYYIMFSESAPWLKLFELVIPILNIIGSLFLYKWGTLYVGDRMDEENFAPFPKEMRLMIIANGISLSANLLGLIGLISDEIMFFLLIGILGNLLLVIGSIVTSVGLSKAGFYLELYTTEDKEKFFSSKTYED
ncbi:MAG: hypothetical protein EU530_00820 [Promethearchaeota archaeon]|nr:MAG: hypothetical protein EU530_00820 [Candidatus Lokiarchaeota archaeon]